MGVAFLEIDVQGTKIEDFSTMEEQTKSGDSTKKMILVQAFHHGVEVATNPQTGEVTNTPQHRALSLTCNLGMSIVEINKALTQAKRCKVCVHFFKMGDSSLEGDQEDTTHQNWLSYTLEDARISSVTVRSPMSLGGGETTDLMDITFTYRKIKWEYLGKSKKAHTSDWKKLSQ